MKIKPPTNPNLGCLENKPSLKGILKEIEEENQALLTGGNRGIILWESAYNQENKISKQPEPEAQGKIRGTLLLSLA